MFVRLDGKPHLSGTAVGRVTEKKRLFVYLGLRA